VALVAISILVRFVASLGVDAPWVAPDEMLYGMLGRSFWATGHAETLAGQSSFYGLYPLFAGAPLAALGSSAGLVALKALQALLVAVPIVVTYVWARALARKCWALAAAVLTAALPALAYSALVMTEITFLAVSTVALWLLWRALLQPSLRNQLLFLAAGAVAVAVRLKAAILLPLLLLAVFGMAWLSRDRRLISRFAPSGIAVGAIAVVCGMVGAARGSSALGAYGTITGRSYSVPNALHWIAYEAGDVLLLVVGLPVLAALVLTVGSFSARRRDGAAALVAVLIPYAILLVVEIGIYVSNPEGRSGTWLNERALLSLAPPLFVALAVWLDRGMPRRKTAALVALPLIAASAFWPVATLVSNNSVPDALTPIPLSDLELHTSGYAVRVVWIGLMVVCVLLPLLLPKHLLVVVPIALAALLATAAAFAQAKLADRASSERTTYFGTSSPTWVDHAARGPVVYLDDDPLWVGSWQLAFWNRKLDLVALVRPPLGVRPDALTVSPSGAGVLADGSGNLLRERFALAPDTITLAGRRVASSTQGRDQPGLTLWHTPSAPQVSTWLEGGPLPEPVTEQVFSCIGALYLDVSAPTGPADLLVSVDGLAPASVPVGAGQRLRAAVLSPPGAAGSGECSYTIRTDGDLTLTRVGFRRGVLHLHRGPLSTVDTTVVGLGATRLPGYTPGRPVRRPKLAYCADGTFQILPAGVHPGATPALFVEGTGLTCAAPPDYVQQGYADQGVPPGIYPLYVPPPAG